MKKARRKNGGLPYNFSKIAELREIGISYEEITEKLSLDGGKKISVDAVRKSYRRGLSYLQASGQGANVASKLRHKTIIMGPMCGCPSELHLMLALGAYLQFTDRPLLKLDFDSAIPALDRWFGADFKGEAADFSQVRQRLAAYQPRNCNKLIRLGSWFTTTEKISSIIRGIKLDEEARGSDVILVQIIDATIKDYAQKLKKWIVDPSLPSKKVIFAPRKIRESFENIEKDFDIILLGFPAIPDSLIEGMYQQRPVDFCDHISKAEANKLSAYLHFLHFWHEIICSPNWDLAFGEMPKEVKQKLDLVNVHYPNFVPIWKEMMKGVNDKENPETKVKFDEFFKYALAGDEEKTLKAMQAFVQKYKKRTNNGKSETPESAKPTD